MQAKRAPFHVTAADCGDFSQTSPVLLSRTASLLNAASNTNRCVDGSALSQLGGTPLKSITPALRTAPTDSPPDTQPTVSSPPSTSAPIEAVRNHGLFIIPSLGNKIKGTSGIARPAYSSASHNRRRLRRMLKKAVQQGRSE